MRQSPYDRTLFIDADIYVVEPIPELFALLDHFDLAATHEEYVNTDLVPTLSASGHSGRAPNSTPAS
jgi:alpha-N-acetylglucosamine transferase